MEEKKIIKNLTTKTPTKNLRRNETHFNPKVKQTKHKLNNASHPPSACHTQ